MGVIEAEAKLGEMLAGIDKSESRRSSRKGTSLKSLPPGIDKKMSHYAPGSPPRNHAAGPFPSPHREQIAQPRPATLRQWAFPGLSQRQRERGGKGKNSS